MKKVRVRFAPSPTGPLHIGGVRTALFNWLFAKQHGGDFILRIEDTDSQRFVQGAEAYIIESLQWCGISPSEGVLDTGEVATEPSSQHPHAPYRQSQRKAIYREYAQQLVAQGNAYYAFDSAESLEELRKEAESKGDTFLYGPTSRNTLDNALGMEADEVAKRLEENSRWVIRFKIPEDEEIVFHDLIRGEVKVQSNTLDDKVLWKAVDELPTYHLANVVDDHLMEISHVIRGEEWLPSLPLHILLYRAFKWVDTQPQFAHLSLLLKPDGKGKLSKRDGDRMGFPVFPLAWKSPEGEISRGYREDGYFPQAVVNMLALLGWNPGTEQEIFSLQELVQLFSIDRVVKSGARFNPEKARWFNQHYLRTKDNNELASLFAQLLTASETPNAAATPLLTACETPNAAATPLLTASETPNASTTQLITASETPFDLEKLPAIVALIKERAVFVKDFIELSDYFFAAPRQIDEKLFAKYWREETPSKLASVHTLLSQLEPFTKESIEHALSEYIKSNEWNMGAIMNTLRLCIVGAAKGPGMADIMAIIGKKETLTRMKRINTHPPL